MTKKNCLLIAVLLISLSANAQQEKHNNVVYLGLGSYMISQNKADPINEFSPTVDVVYNRFLDDGFMVGAGYYFKNINHYIYELNGNDNIPCTEGNHSLMLSLGYKFNISAFNITPYIAAGVGFARYKLSEDYDFYKTKYDTFLMLSPGVRLGYEISRWMVFASYNFNYYKTNTKFDLDFAFELILPNKQEYHSFNIGLGYMF